MQHVVAGLPDRNIQLVVGTDGDELPAVGFVLGQVVVDHGRLRRTVEIVLDLVDLGDLRKFGDVERAVLERDAVGPIQARRQRLDRALAVLVGDGIDVADQAGADEHRALVAFGHRTRVRHAGRVDLDVEAGRQLELCGRQLVRGRRDRRRRDRRKFCCRFIVRTPDQRRAGRKRRGGGRCRSRCGRSGRSRSGRLLRGSTERECTEKSTREQCAACGRVDHLNPPLSGSPYPRALASGSGLPDPQSPIFYR